MNFYKLLDINRGVDVYVNPKTIQLYIYHLTYVEIYLSTDACINVDKSDFKNMMTLEDAKEW